MNRTVFATLVLLCISTVSLAEEATPMELFTRFERYYVQYSIAPDGTHTEERETATKILKERAVEYAKQTSISFSTSVQKNEVLAAYTQKADGRRIDVPKGNYQLDVNGGKDSGSPAFSDYTSLRIIFPDVAVGDTLVLSYKTTSTEAIFPNHFSVYEALYAGAAYDDVRIRVDAPSTLWTQSSARGLVETVNIEKDGRKIGEWTYSNKTPMRPKRKDWSVREQDDEVGLSFSTFKNYGEIAEAYGARAQPKAQVTPVVQKLADDLTAGVSDRREQARVIYEWVARNIHYAGNCVGIGAVVPRDIEFVLENKLGDCKDHATVLQALLSAKGIKSVQALVNAGSSYRLAKVPVVSSVNHVINYIPEFDLYVDSTSDNTPFGWLPVSDAGKPVLHAEGFKGGTRTPTTNSQKNFQRMKTAYIVAADGSISGTVDVKLGGLWAASARARDRDLTAETEVESMKAYFDRDKSGFGFGRIDRDDPKPLTDTYGYKLTFKAKEFLVLPGAGAMYVAPLWSGVAPVQSMLGSVGYREEEAKEVACLGGVSEEEYVITYPKSLKILSVPKNMAANNDVVTYSAKYSLRGNVLSVKRGIVDKTNTNVCPVSQQNADYELGKKAILDLKAQVVYK